MMSRHIFKILCFLKFIDFMSNIDFLISTTMRPAHHQSFYERPTKSHFHHFLETHSSKTSSIGLELQSCMRRHLIICVMYSSICIQKDCTPSSSVQQSMMWWGVNPQHKILYNIMGGFSGDKTISTWGKI